MVPNRVKHLIFQTRPSTSKSWRHDEYSHTRQIVRIGVLTLPSKNVTPSFLPSSPLKSALSNPPSSFLSKPPPPSILVFREPPPLKVGLFSETPKYQSFLSFTLFFLLQVTKFLVKISEFEFLVMTEKNIFAYKHFLPLHISDFNLFLCGNCNPLKKSSPLSQQTPSKSWGPVKPLLLKIWLEVQPPPQAERRRGRCTLWEYIFEYIFWIIGYLIMKPAELTEAVTGSKKICCMI